MGRAMVQRDATRIAYAPRSPSRLSIAVGGAPRKRLRPLVNTRSSIRDTPVHLRIRTTLLFAGLCRATHSSAQDKAATAVTYASPKAVFEAAKKAQNKGDYKSFMRLYDPRSRDILTGKLVATSAIFKVYMGSEAGAPYAGNRVDPDNGATR